MQDFYLIVNWLVTILLLGLGIAALLKNHKLILNRVFMFFAVTIGIWIMASYISNDPANSARASVIGNYFVFLFSYISGYLLLWFAVTLAKDVKAERILRKATIPILLIGATTCTPLVVAGAHRQGSVYAVEFGPLVILYFVGLLVLLVAAMRVLHKNIKKAKYDQKKHLVILYRSMGIALPILLITEFILPAVTGWFGLTNVGIIAMAIPVVGLYYSVVRLKLFNLRLVIVRSLAYVLTLGIIGTGYGAISYYLTAAVSSRYHNQAFEELLNVALIVVVINVYPPMIRRFQRLTNQLFYRDAYEPEELFRQLNTMLVSSLDTRFLMMQSVSIIETALKPEFAAIGLVDAGSLRWYTSRRMIIKEKEFAQFRKLTTNFHHKVIVTEDLEDRFSELRELLRRQDIGVVVRLTQDVRHREDGFGYLILGNKKSGSPFTQGDVNALDTVANELIIAIQNALHFEEIQNFNKTLQDKVVEATKELRRTNEKLKALDETKDDFISMASHQLRTPLTSVKGYLSMVLEGDAGKLTSTEKKMLTQAFISSQRMVYLISDLLNVSRLKTGKFVIDAKPVSLADIINDEIDQLKETAKTRLVELTYDKPAKFPHLMFDETKIRQVIMNFIDNAIYYTPAGGHIRVELVDNPSSVELKVVDDGIGVPRHEQHHLFTKFYRAGNARKARPDGTGLGLFMAKKVVMAQGGAIIFDSQEGKGSTFGFTFSKAKVALPRPQDRVPVEAAL